jgi:hypothetical protein
MQALCYASLTQEQRLWKDREHLWVSAGRQLLFSCHLNPCAESSAAAYLAGRTCIQLLLSTKAGEAEAGIAEHLITAWPSPKTFALPYLIH